MARNESFFQRQFLTYMANRHPNRVFAPKLDLKYDSGKYTNRKSFGMPDTILDVVEFDERKKFHLWELKLLTSNEFVTGKFYGQMMLYNFLFSTEPWNELVGRFAFAGQRKGFVGDVGKILSYLAGFGTGEVAKESDKHASFSTWNLCVCGGFGYELAAGFNPIAWSLWIIGEEYFHAKMPPINFWHFFETKQGFVLKEMKHLSVDNPKSLHPDALTEFRRNEKDFI
jgi:hypothetical protein